jgi:Domain of unknown function (DUF4249)
MKPAFFLSIICILLGSCYDPYTAWVESDEKILVVDGMISNENASYLVSLNFALPFYSDDAFPPVHSAKVSVSDDLGNSFNFIDNGNGDYLSDPLVFTGQRDRTYTLHIETIEGDTFESGPQRLIKEYYPDTVYAEADYQETISRFNEIIVTVRGANIMADITSETDSLPRFRFTSDLVEQYFYAINIPPPYFDPPLYSFYCWETEDISQDVNLTGNEYSLNKSSVSRHEVYFIDDNIYVEGKVYELGSLEPDLSYRGIATPYRNIYNVSHRILYLNQYSLNAETYRRGNYSIRLLFS